MLTARRNGHPHCTPDARVAFITSCICVSRLSQKRRGISSYPPGPEIIPLIDNAYVTIVPILRNVSSVATFFIPAIIDAIPRCFRPSYRKKHHEWSPPRNTFRYIPDLSRTQKRVHAVLECDKSRAPILHPAERNGPDRVHCSNTKGSREKNERKSNSISDQQ